jgi:hypothetical protein
MPFQLDTRLGIELPEFSVPYEEMSPATQEQILIKWEVIRARIPDQIMKFEQHIEQLLALIHEEENWDVIVAHFADISDYASRVNELNMWRRVDPTLTPAPEGPRG